MYTWGPSNLDGLDMDDDKSRRRRMAKSLRGRGFLHKQKRPVRMDSIYLCEMGIAPRETVRYPSKLLVVTFLEFLTF